MSYVNDCLPHYTTYVCLLWFVYPDESSGESTRRRPMWPGFDAEARRHTWVEFVGFLLCSERFFPGYSGFPLSSKTYIRFYLM